MESKAVNIKNMSCQHCVQTIESELHELPGILKVKADLNTKQVDIAWDESKLAWQTIKNLLSEINYPSAE